MVDAKAMQVGDSPLQQEIVAFGPHKCASKGTCVGQSGGNNQVGVAIKAR